MSSKTDSPAKLFAGVVVSILVLGLIYAVMSAGIWALNVLGIPVAYEIQSYIALLVLFLLFGRNKS